MLMNFLLKRGLKENDYIPSEGEPVYTTNTKELLIGDGKTSVKNLSSVSILNNIVKNSKGQLFYVTIDDEGNVMEIKPIKTKIKNNDISFSIIE